MAVLSTILAALATAVGAFGTLTLVTLIIACAPNSSEAALRMIKILMFASLIGGLACLALGVLLMVRGAPLAGGIVGVLPMAVLVALVAWTAIRG